MQAQQKLQSVQEVLTQVDQNKLKEFGQLTLTDEFKLKLAEVKAAVGELNNRDYQYSDGMLLAETFGDEEENWENIDFTQELDLSLDNSSQLRPE
jgi:hypothetical protein